MTAKACGDMDLPASISCIPVGIVRAVLAAWRAASPACREGRTGELLAWAARALVEGREEDAVRVLLADLEGPLADELRAALDRPGGSIHGGLPPRVAHPAGAPPG